MVVGQGSWGGCGCTGSMQARLSKGLKTPGFTLSEGIEELPKDLAWRPGPDLATRWTWAADSRWWAPLRAE